MSDIIVQKFGGTSVGSDERISAVAQIIKNAKKDNQVIGRDNLLGQAQKNNAHCD